MRKVGKTFEESEQKASKWYDKYPAELTVSSSAPCMLKSFAVSLVFSAVCVSALVLIKK